MSKFVKASRQRVFLKLAITGPSGSGKTFSGLRLARGLSPNGKIAVLDTENGSASLYADQFDFDVININPPYRDQCFIDGISDAVKEGYSVVQIDSSSHWWEGVLEYKAALDARGGNSYTNWHAGGTKHKGIMNAVLQSPIHVICCMRSKVDYVLEVNSEGKNVPKKVGMAPIMREGSEYEFTTVLDIGIDHYATTSKDRSGLFVDSRFQVTEETGVKLVAWLNSAKSVVNETPPALLAPKEAIQELSDIGQEQEKERTEASVEHDEPPVKSIQSGHGIILIERLEKLLEEYEPDATKFFLEKKWIKKGQNFRDIEPTKADGMVKNPNPLLSALNKRRKDKEVATENADIPW